MRICPIQQVGKAAEINESFLEDFALNVLFEKLSSVDVDINR